MESLVNIISLMLMMAKRTGEMLVNNCVKEVNKLPGKKVKFIISY